MNKLAVAMSFVGLISNLSASAANLETSKERLWAQASGTMDGAKVEPSGNFHILPILENDLMVLNREKRKISERVGYDTQDCRYMGGSYTLNPTRCEFDGPKRIQEFEEKTTYRIVDRNLYIETESSEGKANGMILGALSGFVAGGVLDYFFLTFPWFLIWGAFVGAPIGAVLGQGLAEKSARKRIKGAYPSRIFTETTYSTQEERL